MKHPQIAFQIACWAAFPPLALAAAADQRWAAVYAVALALTAWWRAQLGI
jgi:hypothetical protein